MCVPVEVATVHHNAAHGHGVSVDILCRGVCNDVRTPLERTAVHRRCEGIVDNQRHTVLMCYARELLYIEHVAARIGYCLAEKQLGVRAECLLNLILRRCLVYESAFYSELLQRHAKQVVRSAIYLVRCHYMVAGLADIEHCIEIGSLSARRERSGHTAFECRNLLSHSIVGRILQTGIEISFFLQVEEHSHLFGIVVFERSALYYRWQHRFAVLRLPPCLNTERGDFQILFHCCYFVLLLVLFRGW